MKIWGKNERSWRRKNGRAVSPIIATILLVAITVVLAAVLYILIQQYTKSGTSGVTIGSALAIGTSQDGVGSGVNYYNMTVESAGSTLTMASVAFEVKGPGGAITIIGSTVGGIAITALSVVVLNPLTTIEATYSVSGAAPVYQVHCTAPAYTSQCSGATLLTTANVFSVQVAPITVSLVGFTLVALGQGSFSGSTSGNIV